MRRFAGLLVAISAVTFGQLATAADMPVKAPLAPAPAAYSWTGFYAGLNAGYGWGHENLNYTGVNGAGWLYIDPTFIQIGIPRSFNVDGFVGGGQVGYNYQFDRRWVAGIEADIQYSDVHGDITFPTGNTATTGFASRKLQWFGTVRPRLGFLPMDRLLVYATGGLAYGQTKATANFPMAGSGTVTTSSGDGTTLGCTSPSVCMAGSTTRTSVGWTAGGGFEYAVWNNISVKAEYLYVKLQGQDVLMTIVPPNTGNALVTALFDNDAFHIARAGLNYRFGAR